MNDPGKYMGEPPTLYGFPLQENAGSSSSGLPRFYGIRAEHVDPTLGECPCAWCAFKRRGQEWPT